MMKKIFSIACLLFLGFSSFAQTDNLFDGFSFSGSVDTYFRQNLNAPNKEVNGEYVAPTSAFANQPGFALGMANLVLGYEKDEKVGVVADLVFGPRGTDAVFGSTTASSSDINQLYVYWNVSEKTTLTLGNFNTFLGYEVISPTGNFNYSTSYAFSYGPFSHSGFKADFTLNDNWTAMAAIMNATDATDNNPTGSYTGGAQLGYTKGSGSAYLNFLYGDQDGDYSEIGGSEGDGSIFQVDLTTGLDLSEKIYVGLNSTYSTTESNTTADDYGFYGAALYLQAATSEDFSIGVRPEYFKQFGGFNAIGGNDINGEGDVFALTLSGNAKIGDLTIIPEFRIDSASEDVYYDTDLNPESSLASLLVAAVYSF